MDVIKTVVQFTYDARWYLILGWAIFCMHVGRKGSLQPIVGSWKALWSRPLGQRSVIAVAAAPLFVFFAAGLFFFCALEVDRAERNAMQREHYAFAQISYQEEVGAEGVMNDQQTPMIRSIIDSLERVGPIERGLLPPYEYRQLSIPGTQHTARLLHVRKWCRCREEADSTQPAHLPVGSFELVVFQLFPTSKQYTIVTDTVMRWVDYDVPFNPHTAN